MVAITEIRSQLEDLSRYGAGLVGVFVGGTSGIGESTAREFVRYTYKPHVYLVGRNQEAAERLVIEFKALNSEAQIEFLHCDAALLRNVDDVCKHLKVTEDRINFLLLSAGIFTLQGRNETAEGLDSKLSLHYYSRMRFVQQLLPLLSKAAETPAEPGKQPLSRVISVLGVAPNKPIDVEDFDLKKNHSQWKAANHAQMGTLLAFHAIAPNAKGVTLIRSQPGSVKTGMAKRATGLEASFLKTVANVIPVLAPSLAVPLQDCGERHLWAATHDAFGKEEVLLLSPQTEVVPDTPKLKNLLTDGTRVKVWDHTQEVFRKICDEGGKY